MALLVRSHRHDDRSCQQETWRTALSSSVGSMSWCTGVRAEPSPPFLNPSLDLRYQAHSKMNYDRRCWSCVFSPRLTLPPEDSEESELRTRTIAASGHSATRLACEVVVAQQRNRISSMLTNSSGTSEVPGMPFSLPRRSFLYHLSRTHEGVPDVFRCSA
ncbi:hypothetical protein OH76DRAFT_194437 [Lentinus brumalis]|uniref:Uncharacterized protein n=1 Tax=Lentinus brumalis TaxID=2498619 RepID=A0A371DHX4_9APHY|nr:hypothetical protein OH76DRAFT_194437 [Polyporus brumalis]